MIKSDSIVELAKALAAAQGELTNASKNANNPHYKSDYADLGEILNVVRPVFSKHGLGIMQMPDYEAGMVTVKTLVTHASGEYISSDIKLPVGKQDAQGVGGAITYARRYSLAAVAGIGQEDDDGNSAVNGGQQRQVPDPAEVERQQILWDAVHNLQPTITAIKEGIASGDLSSASEAWQEMTDDEKTSIWVAPTKGGPFTTEERKTMQTKEFREAYFGPATQHEETTE